MKLKIITPTKQVVDREVHSVSVPSVDGELTILPKHSNLLALLQEGIITMRDSKEEEFMAIGGGYLETDGKDVHILVSRAFNQNEIDEKFTENAIKEAQEILQQTDDQQQRSEAVSLIRRSVLNLKLLKKRRRTNSL